jgi:hypothetical protein
MEITNMFSSHSSTALEYWFFKINSGQIALLVDWVERHKTKEHWLRASIHSPHKREVVFEKLDSFMPKVNFLSTQKTVGRIGEIAWELDIDTGGDWIKPDIFPANLLKISDTIVESAPRAKFTGWIRHGAQETSVNRVSGMISHYWGRQLSPEWWWVSAHQFDQEDVAVECIVARSTLWGSSMQIPLAYLYLHHHGKRELVMAPNQLAHVSGSPEKFHIEINRKGKEKINLMCTGREYGEFGDQIINTLTGDLEIFEGNRLLARANGTAGLERRFPSSHPHNAKG